MESSTGPCRTDFNEHVVFSTLELLAHLRAGSLLLFAEPIAGLGQFTNSTALHLCRKVLDKVTKA